MFSAKWPGILSIWAVIILLLMAIVVTLKEIISPASITLRWDGIKGEITIREGDIFVEKRLAVTADDFFITTSDKLVNANSLIGKLITRVYGGSIKALEECLAPSLTKYNDKAVSESELYGKNKRYPIGSTAVVSYGDKQIFVTALCTVDTKQLHGFATPAGLWQALEGLWQTIAENPKGDYVAIPLLGAGQTGVGLSSQTLIHIIIASYLAFTRRIKHIPDPIHIVLLPEVISQIDLVATRRAWTNVEQLQ